MRWKGIERALQVSPLVKKEGCLLLEKGLTRFYNTANKLSSLTCDFSSSFFG
jgi:hypothetical protein